MNQTIPLLAAKNISVKLSGRVILDHIDVTIYNNELVTLIGPNGAGKTTLVRVLLDLLKPDEGTITKKENLRIGYVPQNFEPHPQLPLTVLDFLKVRQPVSLETIQQTLTEVGADNLLRASLHSLSGGELRRVVLARALLRRPDLLVLDEPVQGVDFSGQVALYDLIDNIRQRHGCGVLMVSHDLHLVMAATDNVICLNQHICCSGTPETVTKDPAYLQLFGQYAVDRLAVYHHHHDHSHDHEPKRWRP